MELDNFGLKATHLNSCSELFIVREASTVYENHTCLFIDNTEKLNLLWSKAMLIRLPDGEDIDYRGGGTLKDIILELDKSMLKKFVMFASFNKIGGFLTPYGKSAPFKKVYQPALAATALLTLGLSDMRRYLWTNCAPAECP